MLTRPWLVLTDSLEDDAMCQKGDFQVRCQLTSTVAIRPAQEMSYRRTMWKIGVQHPINDKRCIFIRGVFWPDDETTKEIGSVFVRPH